MNFEYDPQKSLANKAKHGIDFEQAKCLWGVNYVTLSAKEGCEPRFMIIGKLNHKLFSCIYTMRGSKIRLISCRRSREKEGGIYDESFPE